MLSAIIGNNDGGQLGYEDELPRGTGSETMGDSLPVVDLGRDQRASAIASGFFHTCALLYTGDIKCWGEVLLCCCGVISLVHAAVIFGVNKT